MLDGWVYLSKLKRVHVQEWRCRISDHAQNAHALIQVVVGKLSLFSSLVYFVKMRGLEYPRTRNRCVAQTYLASPRTALAVGMAFIAFHASDLL